MDDISALMKAIDDGQITEVRRLLEAGVDANAMDEEGQSPLMASLRTTVPQTADPMQRRPAKACGKRGETLDVDQTNPA